eukprot:6208522-Pleurochrysis_carterae.AAC.2
MLICGPYWKPLRSCAMQTDTLSRFSVELRQSCSPRTPMAFGRGPCELLSSICGVSSMPMMRRGSEMRFVSGSMMPASMSSFSKPNSPKK